MVSWDPEIGSGRIVQLDELFAAQREDVVGTTVRVLGRVLSVEATRDLATIEYHGKRLIVNLELASSLMGCMKRGKLFHVIGVLSENNDQQLVLNARLVMRAECLDTNFYDRALQMRREFEKRLKYG